MPAVNPQVWTPPVAAVAFFHGRLPPVQPEEATQDFWEKIVPIPLRETVAGAVPAQATWFKVAWDRQSLRVLFHAEDTAAWATLTGRDEALYTEEVVEVFLDPIGDLESYFEIEVNPLNAVCDLVLRRTRSGYRKDFRWNCEGLVTAVCRNARAWSAELLIPFASVAPRPPESGDAWRANFFRIDRPPGAPRELSAWSPTGRPNFHVPPRFGSLEFRRPV